MQRVTDLEVVKRDDRELTEIFAECVSTCASMNMINICSITIKVSSATLFCLAGPPLMLLSEAIRVTTFFLNLICASRFITIQLYNFGKFMDR